MLYTRIFHFGFILFCAFTSLAVFAQAPKLLLADHYSPHLPLANYRVSEKLDGVRAYWDGRQLVSRQGNVFAAPAWFVAKFPAQPLDGELWLGRGRFDELSGIVRQNLPHEGWRQVRFMVFDVPASDAVFDERLAQLHTQVKNSGSEFLAVVEHTPASTHKMLMAQLDDIVAKGGEGLMLRRGDSLYRAGRTGDLIKVKKLQDAEAQVIAHLPGKGKYLGKMGALLVELPDGKRFKVGTGFSDAQRAAPPAIGSWITFTYRGYTNTGLPRFASFLRERPAEDLPP